MADTKTSGITRRDFLVRSAAVAGGAFLSVAVPPSILGGGKAEAAMSATPEFTPSIWFTITPDGMTTMHIIKAEMGQHIGTAFAQIIAEELEVPWDKIRLDMPLESAENFGTYGLAYTVNSGSVTTEFDRLLRAGALGRIALTEAGAVGHVDAAVLEVDGADVALAYVAHENPFTTKAPRTPRGTKNKQG